MPELNENVLTISAEHGLVSQQEFFNKRIASKNLRNYFLLERGEFVYSKSSTKDYPVGAIKRLDEHGKGVVSPLYICFALTDLTVATSDYVAHLFESGALDGQIRLIAKEGGRAHGLLNVKPSEFFEVIANLPSLPEQRKISAILSSVDDAIEKTQAVIDHMQVVKRGLMDDFFARGLPYAEGRRNQWDNECIGNLFELQLGKMLNKAARETVPRFPYLGNKNVRWSRFDFSELRSMHFDERERKKFRLKAGDLLVCEGGEVGRAALWREEYDCYYQKAIHRLRVRDSNRVESRSVLHFMRHAATKGLLTDLSSQSSIAHLTREKLALLRVPLPSLFEQRKIANVLSAVDDLVEQSQATTRQIKLTKRSLMSVLLSGGLRVTPDLEHS